MTVWTTTTFASWAEVELEDLIHISTPGPEPLTIEGVVTSRSDDVVRLNNLIEVDINLFAVGRIIRKAG